MDAFLGFLLFVGAIAALLFALDNIANEIRMLRQQQHDWEKYRDEKQNVTTRPKKVASTHGPKK